MEVKVCGLTRAGNIEAVIGAGADYIGLIFYPASKRYVAKDAALQQFVSQINSVRKVGVFVDAAEAEVLDAVRRYRLDVVQLHGTETPAYCRRINAGVPVWKAFAMQPGFAFEQLDAYAPFCDRFLFDTPGAGYGGTGQAFDHTLLRDLTLPRPFMLAGGIGPGDATTLKGLQLAGLQGVDLNSRFEIQPGYKDAARIKNFIYAIHS